MSRGRSWREVLRSLGKDPGIEGRDLIATPLLVAIKPPWTMETGRP